MHRVLIVCFVRPKTHLAVPCCRLCACDACAAQMQLCPCCRVPPGADVGAAAHGLSKGGVWDALCTLCKPTAQLTQPKTVLSNILIHALYRLRRGVDTVRVRSLSFISLHPIPCGHFPLISVFLRQPLLTAHVPHMAIWYAYVLCPNNMKVCARRPRECTFPKGAAASAPMRRRPAAPHTHTPAAPSHAKPALSCEGSGL